MLYTIYVNKILPLNLSKIHIFTNISRRKILNINFFPFLIFTLFMQSGTINNNDGDLVTILNFGFNAFSDE